MNPSNIFSHQLVALRHLLSSVDSRPEELLSTGRRRKPYAGQAAVRELIQGELGRILYGRVESTKAKVKMMASEQEKTRFRSFAERYIIERCSTYAHGQAGLETAHSDVQEAKRVYTLIAGVAEHIDVPEQQPYVGVQTQQAPQQAAQNQQSIMSGRPTIYGQLNPPGVSPISPPRNPLKSYGRAGAIARAFLGKGNP